MSDDLPRLYTVDELAEYIGKDSPRHILRNLSHWPHIRFAAEVRFTAEHIAAILALHERGTEKAEAPAFSGQRTRGGAR